MRVTVVSLSLGLLLLQGQLWVSDRGLREVWQLQGAVSGQQADNAVLLQRNHQLRAEVRDLKQGLAALEERARHDLGMVGSREVFYQVVDASEAVPLDLGGAPTTRTAAVR